MDNSRMFLVNESTLYGSVVEYLCVPGYTREGPFQRTCEITGYWSGQDPKCYIPRKKAFTPLAGGNSRPYSTGGSVVTDNKEETDNSSIGVWIGVGLGLIVVVGLLVVGIYFYRKQLALHKSKPTRDNNANGLGVLGIPSYAVQSYSASQIGARPPPPIQMYSIDDSPEDHRGPIYDTINDDNSSHSQSTYSQSSDSAYPRSTFGPGQGSPPGTKGMANNGYSNDYDVPEGNERPGSRGNSSVGTVTINGIAV